MELEIVDILLMMVTIGGNVSPWLTGSLAVGVALWKWIIPKIKTWYHNRYVFSVEIDHIELKNIITLSAAELIDVGDLRTVLGTLWWGRAGEDSRRSTPPNVRFHPGMGTHSFVWRGHTFKITREQARQPNTEFTTADYNTTVTLSYKGKNIKPLQDLCDVLVMEDYKDQEGTIKVHTMNNYDGWTSSLSVQKRDLDTVYLPSGMSDRIKNDISEFLHAGKWYANVGVPHRRGYLLHGPPGCGKSSLAKALASHFDLPLYLLSLSSQNLDDIKLSNMLRSVSSGGAIILLEDVDSIFIQRKQSNDNHSRVTMSGLLNALDGVSSQEGSILIMTTNFPNTLDDALIRPGRVDVRLELSYAKHPQMKAMFLKFFPNDDVNADKFVSSIPENTFTLAQIQNHLIEHKHDVRLAVNFKHEAA